MQGYVPYVKVKKKKKRLLVPLIFILVVVIIVFVTLLFYLRPNKKHSYLDSMNLYFVYVDESKTTHGLKVEQDVVKSLGGAGIIYEHNNLYYLITSVYLNKSQAEEVKNNLSKNYENSGVFAVTTKKLSKKKKNLIISDFEINEQVKFLNEFIKSLDESYIKNIAGEISESKFISFLMSNKLKLENNINKLKEKVDEEISKTIFENANMCLLYTENFFDSYFQSNKKHSLICELAVELTISMYELFDNL